MDVKNMVKGYALGSSAFDRKRRLAFVKVKLRSDTMTRVCEKPLDPRKFTPSGISGTGQAQVERRVKCWWATSFLSGLAISLA
jgi:hypothetical protein